MPAHEDAPTETNKDAQPEIYQAFVSKMLAEVGPSIDEMISLMEGHDSFDILALARMHTNPITLNGYQQSLQPAGWATSTEVIALILIGLGMPTHENIAEENFDNSTAEIIPQLVDLSAQISSAATFNILSKSPRLDSEPLLQLAARFASAETAIRGRQYEHISKRINQGVLNSGNVPQYMEKAHGFTYEHLAQIDSAIRDVISEKFNKSRQKLADAFMATGGRLKPTSDSLKGVIDLIGRPGPCWSFTAKEIADRAGIDPDVAEKALGIFSIGEVNMNPHDLVQRYMEGRNPLEGRSIVQKDGLYILLGGGINEDEIRRISEQGLKSLREWSKYDRTRAKYSEKETFATFKSLVGGAEPFWFNFEYYAPAGSGQPEDLNDSADISAVQCKLVESDALFIVDGVAFCIEVKAGEITSPARQGRPDRLAKHLTDLIEKAQNQASRLRELISKNGGVWSGKKKWVPVEGIVEYHTIVVSLDDLGVLSLSADELVRHGTIKNEEIPWIITLHDLIMVGSILDRPAQFLAYLRRRTESEAARLIIAVDELDILMWFVEGQFYFESDPHVLTEKYPEYRPPTTRDYRRHRGLTQTAVEGFTDPLDAWVYAQEGKSDLRVDKPRRRESIWLSMVLDRLENAKPSGWFRYSADLASLSGNTIRSFEQSLQHIADQSQRDGRPHSVNFSGWSLWGCWSFVAGTTTLDYEVDWEVVRDYATLRKYADRSDRAFHALVTPSGEMIRFGIVDLPWVPDVHLRNRVRERGLLDPKRAPSSIPPSAKGTFKKRKKGGKRKRRRK